MSYRKLLRAETEASRARAVLADLEDALVGTGFPTALEGVGQWIRDLDNFRAVLADVIDEEAQR